MKSICLMGLAFAVSACVPATPPYMAAPADPAIGIRNSRYAPVTADVRGYDVVDPLDWRELNRRVTPGSAPERGDSNDAGRGR